MNNPRAKQIAVDDEVYSVMWMDFGSFLRLDIYKDNTRIGFRKLSHRIDQGENMIRYFIRRMVGKYGISRRSFTSKEESGNGGGHRL